MARGTVPLQTSDRKASTLVELGAAAGRVADVFDSDPALVCRRVAIESSNSKARWTDGTMKRRRRRLRERESC